MTLIVVVVILVGIGYAVVKVGKVAAAHPDVAIGAGKLLLGRLGK